MKKYLLLFLLGIASAQGAPLVRWDFSGLTGYEVTVPSYSSAEGMRPSELSRAPGAGPPRFFSPGNVWSTEFFGTEGISLANTAYFQFAVAAEPGAAFSLTSLAATYYASFSFRQPAKIAYAYSIDGGGSFTLLPTVQLQFARADDETTFYSYDLSGVAELQGAASAIFRLYATGASNPSRFGYGDFNDAMVGNGFALVVNGTVPEPTTVGLLGAGILLVLWRACRDRLPRRKAEVIS